MQNNIRDMRNARGLSAAKLADLVGTSQQQIDRLEKSQRRLDVDWVKKIADALDCHPSDIVPSLSTDPDDKWIQQQHTLLRSLGEKERDRFEEGLKFMFPDKFKGEE